MRDLQRFFGLPDWHIGDQKICEPDDQKESERSQNKFTDFHFLPHCYRVAQDGRDLTGPTPYTTYGHNSIHDFEK
jgi:hypothetical protein